jgi:PTS hybrid protein
MVRGKVQIIAAGGTDDGELGTSMNRVLTAYIGAESGDGVLVLVDLGSAALVAEMAWEQLPERRRSQIRLSDAPLVEGAVAAAVEASVGSSLDTVAATASEAAGLGKFPKRT